MVLWVGWSSKHIFLATDSFTLQFLIFLLFFALPHPFNGQGAHFPAPRYASEVPGLTIFCGGSVDHIFFHKIDPRFCRFLDLDLLISTPGTILKIQVVVVKLKPFDFAQIRLVQKSKVSATILPYGIPAWIPTKMNPWRILKLADIPTFKRWFPQQKRQQKKGSKRWRPQSSEHRKISLFIIQLLDDYCPLYGGNTYKNIIHCIHN